MSRRIIVSAQITDEIINNLIKCGFSVIKTCQAKKLDKRICYHPDVQIVRFDSSYFVSSDCYDYYRNILDSNDVFDCGVVIKSPYPYDCPLNITVFGDIAVTGKQAAVPDFIKNVKIFSCNQGYVGCSTFQLGNIAVLTDDESLYDLYKTIGIDCLKVEKGSVALPGFDYGFIGGSGFAFDKTAYFFGDVSKHPDYFNIKDFIECHGFEIVMLSENILTDYGKAVVIF